jgi:hypothetical protein
MHRWRPLRTAQLRLRVDQTWTRRPFGGPTRLSAGRGDVAAVTLSMAGYATSAERLHDFRELVRPWQDQASVKELDEHVAHV